MPRKRSPDSTSDRQRIQFAFNADCNTHIGEVFRYLLKNEHMPSREGKLKGLDAMSAFWRPFAYQEDGQSSEEERRAIARESIETLTRQIGLIRETFGVEKPQPSDTTTSLKAEVQTALSEALQTLIGNGEISAPAIGNATSQPMATTSSAADVALADEGVDFDEDALLGGLFDGSEIAA